MANNSNHTNEQVTDVVVVGAGIIGIACAYYLAQRRPSTRIVLIDPLEPMSLTSAASGENYRSIWPREEIGALTRRSIGLMEDVARKTDNRINLTQRGYLYVSRDQDTQRFVTKLKQEYPHDESGEIRVHVDSTTSYSSNAPTAQFDYVHDGIDVLCGSETVRRIFPHLDPDITVAAHARRAGDLGSQQLGQYFLEHLREGPFTRITDRVTAISSDNTGFRLNTNGGQSIVCENLVNAAGPDAANIATLLGQKLPLKCVAQQKIAFVDRLGAVPRDAPFVIDLDGHHIDWPAQVRDELAGDTDTRWLTELFPGGIHCRPDGGLSGDRIKLGWAFNQKPSTPEPTPPLLPLFPELVVRGAARANPGLAPYIEHLPAHVTHYGGYYTKTDENWPLIGPMGIDGAFVATGLSGYGTMAACSVGELIAAWICGDPIEKNMRRLSLERYEDADLMQELLTLASSGEL